MTVQYKHGWNYLSIPFESPPGYRIYNYYFDGADIIAIYLCDRWVDMPEQGGNWVDITGQNEGDLITGEAYKLVLGADYEKTYTGTPVLSVDQPLIYESVMFPGGIDYGNFVPALAFETEGNPDPENIISTWWLSPGQPDEDGNPPDSEGQDFYEWTTWQPGHAYYVRNIYQTTWTLPPP